MIFVDTNILIDIASGNPAWAGWSALALANAHRRGRCVINAAVYAEFAIGFASRNACDSEIERFDLDYLDIARPAAFLAAQAFKSYQRAGGTRTSVLADFLIGAHALTLEIPLLTRDVRRYRTYFPELHLISPEQDEVSPLEG